ASLQPPGDAFDQPGLVGRARRLAERLRVAQTKSLDAHLSEPGQFGSEVGRHDRLLGGESVLTVVDTEPRFPRRLEAIPERFREVFSLGEGGKRGPIAQGAEAGRGDGCDLALGVFRGEGREMAVAHGEARALVPTAAFAVRPTSRPAMFVVCYL